MNFSELSIKRPVLATVMVLIIVIFGVIGYTNLAVREYPSVDNPIITVNVSYPGANAEVIENQITEPLEQNINGIPGIRSLVSRSSGVVSLRETGVWLAMNCFCSAAPRRRSTAATSAQCLSTR